MSDRVSCRRHFRGLQAVAVGIAVALGLLAGAISSAVAESPLIPIVARSSALEATTSDAAKRDAIRSIPFDKLSADDRARVQGVLSNLSLFRRLPTRVVDCDPELYVFLVRHPDVVVNIWEMFKISRLQLRKIDEGEFRVSESAGASATIRFVYQNHDTHVIYGEGVYRGPLLARSVKGRGVLILKSGYVRETNGRYYITSRMDSFLSIEPSGAEIVTKTLSPVLGKTVDNNFTQTLAFVGSLSRTAEVNSRGVQRLGGQLMHVPPEVRERFVELAADMPRKQPAAAQKALSAKVASQPGRSGERIER
ncbi:MAG: hypothetical protein WCB27_15570 [Thermoguttaceae bacterium]|jgi:hypothetical protein